MSKPAAERPLWVHQDRLDLPFPAVQGTALLLKARFLLSGMGRCVKFFSLQKGFFFALLLIFPLWEEKDPACPIQEDACHNIFLSSSWLGIFSHLFEKMTGPQESVGASLFAIWTCPSAKHKFPDGRSRSAGPACSPGTIHAKAGTRSALLPVPLLPQAGRLPKTKTLAGGHTA